MASRILVPLVSFIAALLAEPCPVSYDMNTFPGGQRCSHHYSRARWESIRDQGCYELPLAENMGSLPFVAVDKYWVMAIVLHKRGPVVDINPKSPRYGRPIFTQTLWGNGRGSGEMCVVYDKANSTFDIVSCREEHRMVCLSDLYYEASRVIRCETMYYYVDTPIPMCVTKDFDFNGSHQYAMDFCRSLKGSLLNKGRFTVNNEFLNNNYSQETKIPINPDGKVISNDVYYMQSNFTYLELNRNRLFTQVFCEYDPTQGGDDLIFSPDPSNKKNILVRRKNDWDLTDVICLTDTETYYPTKAKVIRLNQTLMVIEREYNGNYWCVSNGKINKFIESQLENESLWPKKKIIAMYLSLKQYQWEKGDEKLSFDAIQHKIEKHWKDSIMTLWQPGMAPSFVIRNALNLDDILIIIEDSTDNTMSRNFQSPVTKYELTIVTNTRSDERLMYLFNSMN